NYSVTLAASGTTPITWQKSSGNLPDGLTLANNGVISGTPTKAGTFSFAVKASNTAGNDSRTFTIIIEKPVKPKITTKTLISGAAGKSYSAKIDFTGSTLTSVSCKNLPAGLNINTQGEISGTPTQPGDYSLSVTFINSAGQHTKSVKLAVYDITDYSLPVGISGKSYKGKFTSKGLSATKLQWTISSGSLPEGLTLAKGKISGKPKEIGTFNFTLRAGDGNSYVEKPYSITITPVPPKIKTSSLPKTFVHTNFYGSLTLKNGDKPVTWTAEGLPSGLTLDPNTGIITGTPTHIFKGTVAITATNSAGSDTKNVKLTIKAIKPKILTSSLTEARVGQSYNFTLEASGSPVLTWSGEDLPAWLSISSNGKISGTPKESGKFKFYVTVANEAGSKRKKLTLTVKEADTTNSADSDSNSESESVSESESTSNNENLSALTQPEIIELSAGALGLVSNDNFMIAAILPDIQVTESGLYEFTVSLDERVPENSLLVWHSFPNGQEDDSNNDSAAFFDENGEEIYNVPENYCVTVSAWLEARIIYKPVISVNLKQTH
ncbi:MAG: putative Ig domain-containing protein, partial [Synergistaceae bacterium]|nr:putative Ig domain-containing protein [Synergistaceae bacterium]